MLLLAGRLDPLLSDEGLEYSRVRVLGVAVIKDLVEHFVNENNTFSSDILPKYACITFLLGLVWFGIRFQYQGNPLGFILRHSVAP